MSFLLIGTSPKVLTHYARHNHATYEIILNLDGSGTAEIGGKAYPFRAGTVHVIPPSTPHTNNSTDGFRDIYIQAKSLQAPMPESLQDVLSLEDDGDRPLTHLMKMMLYRHLGGNKNDSVLSTMYELFLQLLAEKCTSLPTDPIVEAVRRNLMLHFNDPEFSLSSALEETGYQKDYIRRRFIAVCGATPGECLTALRIEHAKKLLMKRKETGLSIADIGSMCGYYDGRYFSRTFKKHVGVTPTEFWAE